MPENSHQPLLRLMTMMDSCSGLTWTPNKPWCSTMADQFSRHQEANKIQMVRIYPLLRGCVFHFNPKPSRMPLISDLAYVVSPKRIQHTFIIFYHSWSLVILTQFTFFFIFCCWLLWRETSKDTKPAEVRSIEVKADFSLGGFQADSVINWIAPHEKKWIEMRWNALNT